MRHHSVVAAMHMVGRATNRGVGPAIPEEGPKIHTSRFGPRAFTGEGMVCARAQCIDSRLMCSQVQEGGW